MKKIFLLSAAFTMLLSDWATAQVARTPLVEEFTQASCPNCPRANTYLNPLLATYPLGQVVAIKYQVDFPGVDTLNLQDPADAATRFAYYSSFSGVPVAAIDGDTGILSTAIAPDDYNGDPNILTPAMISSEMGLTTPISLTATFSYNASTDSFTTRIVATNVTSSTFYASAHAKLKLQVSLEEMNIHFTVNPPGDNGEFDFYYINRKMYPSASGTTMADSIQSGDSAVYTFTEKVPSYIYNTNELGVAAFIQDNGIPQANHSVIQAVYATIPNVTDAKMVDNTANYPASNLVCGETFTPNLTLTNGGTTTLTSATIEYYYAGSGIAPVTQNWTGSLAAGANTTITFPTATVPDNTYGTVTYAVNNLNGGALIDINDANNTPQSATTLVAIPDTAAMDTLSEGFDEYSDGLIYYPFSPISLNADPSSAFGYIVDYSFIDNNITGSTTYETSQSAVGGYALSDASYWFPLYSVNAGVVDGLVFDKVDRAGYKNSDLIFQHAYCGYQASADQLNVMVSIDCGQHWITLWSKTGSALATSPDVNPAQKLFIPTSTQWATDTVDMSAYNDLNGVIVQFQCTSGANGNALYIDNINWAQGTANTGIHNIANVSSASVYPNPASGNVNLALNLTDGANFDINVVNTLGQTVRNVSNGELNAGTHTMDVNVADLAPGVYNFEIKSNGQTQVERFVVTQ